MTDINYLLQGEFSADVRIWSALAPSLIIFSYLIIGAIIFMVRARIHGTFRDQEISQRGSSALLGMGLRHYFAWIVQPPLKLLLWIGLPANALTTLSLILAGAAAVALAAGRCSLGGWLYLLCGLCDFFDGRIARLTKSASPAGAALDSILDRVSDGIVLVGLSWFYRDTWVLPVIGGLMIASFLVSYVRARGEALGVDVKVGLMQRPERMVYLGLALALSPILEAIYLPGQAHPFHHLAVWTIVLLTIATALTAAHRLIHTLRALSDHQQPPWLGVDRGGMVRFTVASTLATAADFVVFLALVALGGMVPWIATLLGKLVGGLLNFGINRIWTFGVFTRIGPQITRYVYASGSSALLNAGGVAVLLLLPGLDYRLAWLIAAGTVFLCWNYVLNRDYVFVESAPRAPSQPLTPSPAAPPVQPTMPVITESSNELGV